MDDQETISRRNRSSERNKTLKIILKTSEPISKRTRSKTFEQKYTTPSHSRALATHLITHTANSVLEHETGKQLNYVQLRTTPDSKKHGKHNSQMKWVDCAKAWVKGQMERLR